MKNITLRQTITGKLLLLFCGILGLLVYFGCQNTFTLPQSGSSDQGKLVLSFSDTVKTVFPESVVFSRYELDFYRNDTGVWNKLETKTIYPNGEHGGVDELNVNSQVELLYTPGTYRIEARGYIQAGLELHVASATSPGFTLQANLPTQVSILLKGMVDPAGPDGKLTWTVKLPNDNLNKASQAAFTVYNAMDYIPGGTNTALLHTSLRPGIAPWNGPTFPSEYTYTTSAAAAVDTYSGDFNLPPGYYVLTMNLMNSGMSIPIGKTEIAHINSSLNTSAVFDFTSDDFYPRIVSVAGNAYFRVGGIDKEVYVRIFEGDESLGFVTDPETAARQIGTFLYTPPASSYILPIQVPAGGTTLQFMAAGFATPGSHRRLDTYSINDSGTVFNKPFGTPLAPFNIPAVPLNLYINPVFAGLEEYEIYWISIEVYEEYNSVTHVFSYPLDIEGAEPGQSFPEMTIDKEEGSYPLRVQIVAGKGIEVRTFEKWLPSGVFTPSAGGAEMNLGTVYFGANEFNFSGTLTGDLATINGWTHIRDDFSYVAAYCDADLTQLLGKTLTTGNNWSNLKVPVPDGTEEVYFTYEFKKSGINYRVPAGSYALTSAEKVAATLVPVPREEKVYTKTGIALAMDPNRSNIVGATVFVKEAEILVDGTGDIWLIKPNSSANYAVGTMSAQGSDFSPHSQVFGPVAAVTAYPLPLESGTTYVVLAGDSSGNTGKYSLNVTTIAGNPGGLQFEDSWYIQYLLDNKVFNAVIETEGLLTRYSIQMWPEFPEDFFYLTWQVDGIITDLNDDWVHFSGITYDFTDSNGSYLPGNDPGTTHTIKVVAAVIHNGVWIGDVWYPDGVWYNKSWTFTIPAR